MSEANRARQTFRALIHRPDEQIDLAEAALCIAWEDQAVNGVRAALDTLDAFAALAAPAVHAETTPEAQVQALVRCLAEELGFHGNTWQLSDPVNSYLDQVINNRYGLPITLSIIYIEIGRRLGLPLIGLALPGHFLVQYRGAELYFDPFNRGRRWSRAECVRQIVAAYGASSGALIERVMAPPTNRAVLARVLRNLKNAAIDADDFELALRACERVLLLVPGDAAEIRDRGVIRAHLGNVHLGMWDLNAYAQAEPGAQDLELIRRRAHALADDLVGLS
jgi:regulator of sirC expression with transglutaminase-like and TPR domain